MAKGGSQFGLKLTWTVPLASLIVPARRKC